MIEYCCLVVWILTFIQDSSALKRAVKCQIPLGNKAETTPKYRKSWNSDLYPITEARQLQLVIKFLTCPAVHWLWLLWEMRLQVYLEWVKRRSCCCITPSVATGRAGNTVWKEVTQVFTFVAGFSFNWDNHTLLPRDLPHMTPVQLWGGIQDVSQGRIWLCNFSSGKDHTCSIHNKVLSIGCFSDFPCLETSLHLGRSLGTDRGESIGNIHSAEFFVVRLRSSFKLLECFKLYARGVALNLLELFHVVSVHDSFSKLMFSGWSCLTLKSKMNLGAWDSSVAGVGDHTRRLLITHFSGKAQGIWREGFCSGWLLFITTEYATQYNRHQILRCQLAAVLLPAYYIFLWTERHLKPKRNYANSMFN